MLPLVWFYSSDSMQKWDHLCVFSWGTGFVFCFLLIGANDSDGKDLVSCKCLLRQDLLMVGFQGQYLFFSALLPFKVARYHCTHLRNTWMIIMTSKWKCLGFFKWLKFCYHSDSLIVLIFQVTLKRFLLKLGFGVVNCSMLHHILIKNNNSNGKQSCLLSL